MGWGGRIFFKKAECELEELERKTEKKKTKTDSPSAEVTEYPQNKQQKFTQKQLYLLEQKDESTRVRLN